MALKVVGRPRRRAPAPAVRLSRKSRGDNDWRRSIRVAVDRRRGIIPQTTPTRDQQSYRHEAFFWHGAEDYTAQLTGFISEALEAEEPVLVAVTPEHQGWLSDGLGDRARDVGFVDMTRLGANPARILPRWQEFLDANAGRPVRGVGEPIWPGRRAPELAECQLHEALLNVAVDPLIPLWLMCPYDSEGLDPDVVAEAHRSHPVIVEAAGYHGSLSYAGRSHVDSIFATDLPTPESEPITTTAGPGNVDRLESYVRLECYVAGLPAATAARLAEATRELASAGLHRGAAEVTVRIWNEPDTVACEVADSTSVTDPLYGRQPPAPDAGTRLVEPDGLWFANQLCDLVQLRSNSSGTVVRVHAWR